MGEQSTLWTNLSLGFYVYKEGRGKEGWEVDEEGRVDGARVRIVDGEEVCDSVDICGWTEQLVKLLTMPRLQCLEHLELIFFFMGEIFWEDCMLFLQLVSDFAPSVKKLSWIGGGVITVTPNPTQWMNRPSSWWKSWPSLRRSTSPPSSLEKTTPTSSSQ